MLLSVLRNEHEILNPAISMNTIYIHLSINTLNAPISVRKGIGSIECCNDYGHHFLPSIYRASCPFGRAKEQSIYTLKKKPYIIDISYMKPALIFS